MARKASKTKAKVNGSTPPQEFLPLEYLARDVMDWLDAIGKAIQAQRRVEARCRALSPEAERAVRGEVA